MPHIDLDPSLPGIVGLLRFRPETAAPLTALSDVLLQGPNSLSPGERELIAAVVSRRNDCSFCELSHAATAAAHLPDGMPVVAAALDDPATAPVSEKLQTLLKIAAAVATSGAAVTPDLIAAARDAGATDTELHDTVLIAAAFCMFNRYVDGLATQSPTDPAAYTEMGAHLAAHGYAASVADRASPDGTA
jgi:uncharacterized peroxidase-related enzyme